MKKRNKSGSTASMFCAFVLLLTALLMFALPFVAGAASEDGETEAVTSYRREEFKVSFDLNYNGGERRMEMVPGGQVIPQDYAPKREGYTFGGWSTSPSGRTPYDPEKPVWSNLMLYAVWRQDCQVSFLSEFGTAPGPQTLSWGSSIQEPDPPAADGYVFDGWFTSSDYRRRWDFEADTAPEKKLTLYARWSRCVSIMVDPHNGQGANVFEGAIGHTVNQSLLPYYSNGELAIEGYYTDRQYEHRFDIDRDLIPGDMELHIKWAKSCSVTFSPNHEGFADQTMKLFDGGPISPRILEQALSELVTADGQTRAYHWYKDKECTQPWDPETDCAYDGLVLYPDWGYSFEAFLDLIGGQYFAAKDRKDLLVANAWPNGTFDIGDKSGGYSLVPGKIDKVGNVYSIYPDRITGTASYTMNGDTAVSLSYTGESFDNGTYDPCWQVYCDSNGGSMWGIASRILVYDGERAEKPRKEDQPYRENYTFIGWFTEKEGGSEFDFRTPIHENTRIYAHWYREFTVTLNDNREDGKTRQVRVKEGEALPESVSPSGAPTGHRFSGWYIDQKCRERFDGPVTADILLYAGWERNEYTVSFDVQGHGTNPEPIKALYDSPLIYVPTPSFGLYSFEGWYRNRECTYLWSYANHTVTEDITLYAKWRDPCTVTFVTTGNGPTPESITVMYDSKIRSPEIETTEYKSFDGWYTDEAYTRPWRFSSDTAQGDITLYGRWRDACMVSFVTDHGDAPQSRMVPFGERLSRPDDPWADGYVFSGWYRDSSFTTPWSFDTDRTPESYLFLYARWEKEVWIMIDPHNGGDALVLSGVTGELLDLSGLPPIRNGAKEIAGWYTDSAFQNPFDTSSDRVVEGLSLHIAWKDADRYSASTFGVGNVVVVSALAVLLAAAVVVIVIYRRKRKSAE